MNSSGQSDPVTRWARRAVDGKFVVGELVRHAAERHLKDLVDGPRRGIHWDPVAAGRILRFMPAMFTVTAGAMAGHPFVPLPWHMFCAGSLFGWKLPSGRLRFRSAWMETGKGQAKSPFMGAIGLYMMGWHGIPRAEVYAIGWEKRTANILFTDAVAMCRAQIPHQEEGDTLEARGEVMIRGVLGNAWKIEHPATGSFFQALANTDAQSGPRPACIAADEIHEFKDREPLDTQRRAIDKQAGDALLLMGTNTPASSQIVGTELSERYQKISKGEYDDDESFAYIARIDEADRETVFDNEQVWVKSLPALGVTFPIENIRGAVNTARTSMADAMSVKRLYFGIPTGSVSFWIAEELWAAVQGEVDTASLKGCKCWLSLDLSQKNDLTALTAAWLDAAGHLWQKTWYWTTQAGLEERSRADNAPYMRWVKEGWLNATPGAVIDKTFVAAEVAQLCQEFDVQFLAFDVAGIADFIAACEEIGFPIWKFEGKDKPAGKGLKLVPHAQGKRRMFEERQLTMPTSIERYEDRIRNKTITIEASPVTYMCAANTMIDMDGQGNRCFDKKRSRGRIDGNVTGAMSAGAADADFEPKKLRFQMIFV